MKISETQLHNQMLHYSVLLKLFSPTIGRIKAIQGDFRERFRYQNAKIKYPHMTLGSWQMHPRNEEKAFFEMEEESKKIEPLSIKLNGFGLLNGAFCVAVDRATEVSDRIFYQKGNLKERLGKKICAKNVSLITKLHITVAQKLSDRQLKEVWEEWQSRRFQHEFKAEGMFMLRYLSENKMQVIREFDFQGNGNRSCYNGIQTSLFT